jgi:hypothetical protein
MPFLLAHSSAAWLFPAVALPILFHLFFRLRRQVREFPSLMFFLRIDPRLSAKRKIHEWLILVLRCLFLALLIAALTRPLVGLKSSVENVARLVLIDNSGSMAGPTPGGISKLTLAERASEKLIAASRPGDSIAVQLMVPDPTVALPPGFDAPPAILRDALGKLTPTDAAASIPKALRAALATLESAKQPQRELHILTDLQQKNWSRGDIDSQETSDRIIVHRIDSAPLTTGSVSIQLAEIPARAIPAGRVTPVRVVLQNNGPVAAHVRLNSTDDSGKNISHDLEVPPSAPTSSVLTFAFANPGFHWAQVWVEGDASSTASHADLGVWITAAQKVFFVGDKDDFAAMPYAVSPGGNSDLSGLDATFVGEPQLISTLATKPLAVVLTWQNWPQDAATSQAMQDYVRQGGTLVLVPAPDTGAVISPPVAPWIEASLGTIHTAKDSEPVILLQDGDALWRDLRDTDGRAQLGLVRVLQYRPLKTSADWHVLISSAQGAPLLARRDLDHGHIFTSGLAFSPRWSSLPLKGSFVVLMQNLIFGDQSEHIPIQNIHAGDLFHFDFSDGPTDIRSLAGGALDWHGQAREFEGFPHAGIYEVSQRDHVNWIATSGSIDEADPHFLPPGQIPLLRTLPHQVVSLTDETDITQTALTRDSGTSLYRWLLLVALLLLLAETWLANERSSDLGRKLFTSLISSKTATKPPAKPAPALTKV